MDAAGTLRLTATQVRSLDPYALMAVLGKRVIHPGGRQSTEELLRLGDFQPGQEVLDVGCGVGTTAIRIAQRFGAEVAAVDISPLMLRRAEANVARSKVRTQVSVERGDILALEYPDNTFDRVTAEAVTMFVNRPRAAKELVRVCKPGGKVLATEFVWRKPPTPEARRIFQGEVCPGLQFETTEEWVQIYEAAGLTDIRVVSGPFEMMTPSGFLKDEGLGTTLAVMGRACSRWSYLRKMAWLMPRMQRAVPYLGYVLVLGTRPA
jgi:ubiquinone/menaquinone biosynthesis C-methylase UbiE